MATTTNISGKYAGQDLEITLSVTDDDGEDKTLTGATDISFTIDAPTQITKDLDDGVAISSAPNAHQCVITLAPADWQQLGTDTYPYQVWVTDSAGKRTCVADGVFTLKGIL